MDYVEYKVEKNRATTHPKKLAAIFDIDETSLSNYSAMVKMDFGGTPKDIANQEQLASDPAILDTLKLYNLTKEKGVSLFFVTGRREYQRQTTIKNLQLAGYQGWKQLFMKPNNYHQNSIISYKSGAREKIKAQGYGIILNIGDQESDLKGGYADKTFKLPNPYYFIP